MVLLKQSVTHAVQPRLVLSQQGCGIRVARQGLRQLLELLQEAGCVLRHSKALLLLPAAAAIQQAGRLRQQLRLL